MKTKRLSKKSNTGRRHTRRLKSKGLDTPEKVSEFRAANGRVRLSKENVQDENLFARMARDKARKAFHDANNAEIDEMDRRKALVEVSRVLDALSKAEATKIARERAAFVVSLPAKLGGQPADRIAEAYSQELNEIHGEYVKQFRALAGI